MTAAATTAMVDSPSSPRQLLTRSRRVEIGRIVLTGIVIFAYSREWVPVPALWAAVAVGLYPLLKTGIADLVGEHKIGTEIFVTIATVVALLGGETVAGAVLMVIILIAEFVADLNTDRARSSIRGLIGSVPTVARVRTNGAERDVGVDELRVEDIVLVRAGDRIPVDGTVVGGDGAVDEAPITGESIPKDKADGSTVFAGTVLKSGALDVRVERVGEETTFARIVTMVEEAEESKAPVQRLADRVAAWLLPVVFVFLVVVFLLTHDIRKIVTLMIFTSPAELGLATPMVMIAAIARAARSGILVKGGAYLESLAHVDTVAFDKTGTLTIGEPRVDEVRVIDPSHDADTLLALAAGADRRSGHPLAQAVVEHAATAGIMLPEATDFEVIQGRGVTATVQGRAVVVGNAAMLREASINIPDPDADETATMVYVAADSRLTGIIRLSDQVRPGAAEAIAGLRANGIQRIAMLTGDNAATANAVADTLGIDDVFADLLPDHKVDAIRQMQQQGSSVAMVGDGINDAPALALADVGIAMGAGGTQAALEAADVALMTNDLSKIVMARAIARRAYRTIKENLLVGVGVVHVLGITAALLGIIGPVQAAFIHLGPDILVFVNSTKLLRVRIEPATPAGEQSHLGPASAPTGGPVVDAPLP